MQGRWIFDAVDVILWMSSSLSSHYECYSFGTFTLSNTYSWSSPQCISEKRPLTDIVVFSEPYLNQFKINAGIRDEPVIPPSTKNELLFLLQNVHLFSPPPCFLGLQRQGVMLISYFTISSLRL